MCNGNISSKLLLENRNQAAATGQTEIIYKPEEVDVRAIVDRKKMKRPSGRFRKFGEGKVVLKLVLHSSGKVTEIEVVEGTSCKIYQEDAIRAARQIKFIPAQKNGLNVSQYQQIEYAYTYTDETGGH